MLKKIVVAAAVCAALGTCTIGAADISSMEPAENGGVTVIKGKVIETVLPKKNHKKDKKAELEQEGPVRRKGGEGRKNGKAGCRENRGKERIEGSGGFHSGSCERNSRCHGTGKEDRRNGTGKTPVRG